MVTLNEIINYFQSGMNWQPILILGLMAVICGLFVALTYHYTHDRKDRNVTFEACLVATTVISAMTICCISNTISAIVGVAVIAAGSLFRVAVTKEQQDERYYSLWAACAGICIGEKAFLPAALISVFVFLIFLICRFIGKRDIAYIVIKGVRDRELETKGVIFKSFGRKAKLKTQTSEKDSFELVYEVNTEEINRKEKENENIIGAIYDIGGIDTVMIKTGADKAEYEN